MSSPRKGTGWNNNIQFLFYVSFFKEMFQWEKHVEKIVMYTYYEQLAGKRPKYTFLSFVSNGLKSELKTTLIGFANYKLWVVDNCPVVY